MALVTDLSTLFSFTHLVGYTGQTSSSVGSQDLTSVFVTSFGLPVPADAEFNTTNLVTFGFNTYYKMEGFNPVTNQYENWHSMGTPLLVPPSGHPLQNVSIVGTWTDR